MDFQNLKTHRIRRTSAMQPAVFNPFDTKHGAKTAVKFSVLRMVMLWSS